jgi:hypothetical protein
MDSYLKTNRDPAPTGSMVFNELSNKSPPKKEKPFFSNVDEALKKMKQSQ